jgi:uncharacterized membrane protein YheB (UPF0754 family)
VSNRSEYKKALAALIASNQRADELLITYEELYPELKIQNWLTHLEYQDYIHQVEKMLNNIKDATARKEYVYEQMLKLIKEVDEFEDNYRSQSDQ